ncbi:MAG: hypothetical protein U0835_06870 [Isosphaeraceae bacterium]
MSATLMIIRARCTVRNHPSSRFCDKCGLPLGSTQPDAEAGADALGPYEAPEPADPDPFRAMREIIEPLRVRGRPSARLAGRGPLQLDCRQVYLGHAGTDPEGRTDPLPDPRSVGPPTTATAASS